MKIENTVPDLGLDVEDALALAEALRFEASLGGFSAPLSRQTGMAAPKVGHTGSRGPFSKAAIR
jgi:hypothetical protein